MNARMWILSLLCVVSMEAAGLSQIPGPVSLDREAIARGILVAPLRLEMGDEVLFVVDTGSPVTLLDKAFNGKLGKRIGRFEFNAWEVKQKAEVYAAPGLYLGDTPLLTGSNVLTCDFKKFSKDFGWPVKGILGMDCLQHYCIQIDFAAGQMRFPASASGAENPGKEYRIILSDLGQSEPDQYRTFINNLGLLGGKGTNLLVDTGLDLDGAVAPGVLDESTLRGNGIAFEKIDETRWYISECAWEGNTYTNLVIREADSSVAGEGGSVLGLRFLARHLVTFDFPNRTLYLERQSTGPCIGRLGRVTDALMPVNGVLPGDIDFQLNALLKEKRPPFWVRWFGGVLNLRNYGDPTTLHYSFGKKFGKKLWKVKKAWRTDSNGETIETFEVP